MKLNRFTFLAICLLGLPGIIFYSSGCSDIRALKMDSSGNLSTSSPYFETSESVEVPDMDDSQSSDVFDGINLIGVSVQGKNFTPIGSGDFNADGFADVISRDLSTGEVLISLLKVGKYQSSGNFTQIKMNWNFEQVADINGDSKSDLIFRNKTNGTVVVYLMNGTSILSTETLPAASLNYKMVAAGDFNGDGQADILFREKNNGTLAVWLMNGGKYSSAVFFSEIPLNWTIQAVGDIDGNGSNDILWRRDDGLIYAWFMNRVSIQSTSPLGGVSSDWSVEGLGDFDGNGQSDILFRNLKTGSVATWLMTGKIRQSVVFFGSAGAEWQIQAMGDLDANGIIDLIFKNNKQPGLVAAWTVNDLRPSYLITEVLPPVRQPSTQTNLNCDYYVSANGGNDGAAGTLSAPFKSLERGASTLKPGDTLCIRGGTYQRNSTLWNPPSGTSWTNAVSFKAYNNEKVIVKGATITPTTNVFEFVAKSQFIIMDGLTITEGYDGVRLQPGVDHVRIINCEIMNNRNSGILTGGNSDSYSEFINLKVHHNGRSQYEHGIYMTTSHNLVKDSEFYNNAGWGIHVFDSYGAPSYNVIINNKTHDNATAGKNGSGIIISRGTDNIVANNESWGNPMGIQIWGGAKNTVVCNNNSHMNNQYGIWVSPGITGTKIGPNTTTSNGTNLLDQGINTDLNFTGCADVLAKLPILPSGR